MMNEKMFPSRLNELRQQKGVSARDMSLSIGQNPGYINNIESGKALPSMTNFFYICDYLEITPQEFFEVEVSRPKELRHLESLLQKLDSRQLDSITTIVEGIVKD